MNKTNLTEVIIRIDERLNAIEKAVSILPTLKETVDGHSAYWKIFAVIGSIITVVSGVWAVIR